MPRERSSSYHVVFIITGSFGELFNAMYLAMGCGFRTTFVMPASICRLNGNVLPGKCLSYVGAGDLTRIVETERPDIVFFFSGYLCARTGAMDFEGVDRFLERARALGVKVATSDPFLGLTARMPLFDPRNPIEQLLTMPLRVAGELAFGSIFGELTRATSSLRRIPHVYVVDPALSDGIPRFAFFNSHMRGYVAGAPPEGGRNPSGAYWLFILAATEYTAWVEREGCAATHEGIARKLREALQDDRHAVLLAPQACVKALLADASLATAILLDTCDYDRYMGLLIGAEYAFYWNIFSASILGRLVNRGPMFFLGGGHLADANEQLFERGMERYYRHARLPHVDPGTRLSVRYLAARAAKQEEELFRPFLDNVSRLPAPPSLVRKLVDG